MGIMIITVKETDRSETNIKNLKFTEEQLEGQLEIPGYSEAEIEVEIMETDLSDPLDGRR
jgi:hypothetical protein